MMNEKKTKWTETQEKLGREFFKKGSEEARNIAQYIW